jgi:hypothetical protein
VSYKLIVSAGLMAHTGRATPNMPEQGFQWFVSDISEDASSSAECDVILYVTIRKLRIFNILQHSCTALSGNSKIRG